MNWEFLDKNIIREKESGYVVELISGTWRSPREIKPITPRRTRYHKQAELLRHGLAFAFKDSKNRVKITAMSTSYSEKQ